MPAAGLRPAAGIYTSARGAGCLVGELFVGTSYPWQKESRCTRRRVPPPRDASFVGANFRCHLNGMCFRRAGLQLSNQNPIRVR